MEIERMSAEEIRKNYREAKHKSQQIGILADLNACKREDIKQIISGATDELPPVGKRRPQNKSSYYLTDEVRQTIINMYLDGMTNARIAAATGRSYPTVCRTIKKYREESEDKNMIFAEEQTEQEREQLTAEIEDKLNAAQPSENEEEAVGKPVFEVADAPQIAAALMDLLLNDLRNFAVEIRIKDGSYIVRVASAEEEIIHTKRRAST